MAPDTSQQMDSIPTAPAMSAGNAETAEHRLETRNTQHAVEFSVKIHDTQDAFDELLTALNPYADELVYQPIFHLFTKLPVELRFKIYDEYFLDENSSIACHKWPNLKFTTPYVNSIYSIRKSAPFLPNLCLTNKELRSEMLSCLLEAAHLDFDNPDSLIRVTLSLLNSSMMLAHKIRKATMQNINEMRQRMVIDEENNEHIFRLAQRMIEVHGRVIALFPRLRELALTCYAPLFYEEPVHVHGLVPLRAYSIENYLEKFPLGPIFGLEELQRFSIIGIGGSSNPCKKITGCSGSIVDDNKADNLLAVSDLCRKIKKGFGEQGRNVRVTARLQWAPEEYMEETFN